MFKCIPFLLTLLIPLSTWCQSDLGIDVDKKEKLSATEKSILEDSIMSDRFVLTELALRMNEPLEEQLLPVDTLVEIAYKNHPNIDVLRKVVEREKANYKHEKVLWTRNIFGTGFYFQGNNNSLVTSTFDANASTSLSNGARYGLTVNVPLYEFVGRKRKNKIAKLNYESEELRVESQKLEIAREVAAGYAALISAQKLFFIASDGLQASSINKENAENQFEAGFISVAELSRILEIHLRIRTDYERARANFFNTFNQFEYMVGEKMENLVKN